MSKGYMKELFASAVEVTVLLPADIGLCAFPDWQEESRTCQYSLFHFGFHFSRCCFDASPIHSTFSSTRDALIS